MISRQQQSKPPTDAAENRPTRRFMLKKTSPTTEPMWLNKKTVYEGKLISMASRVVRLYAPDQTEKYPHVDLSYDWVNPVR